MPEQAPFSAERPNVRPEDTGKFVEGFAIASYWDGLELRADAPPTPKVPEDERSKKQALGAIAAYRLSGKPFPPIPIQSFLPGQEFDPADHPPGTLFWAYEETLAAPIDKLPIKLYEREPMTHTPTVSPNTTRLGIQEEWMYSGRPLWLATGEGHRGSRHTYAATTGEMAMTPQGPMEISIVEARPDGPMTVGAVQQETSHLEGGPSFAILRRTLIVHSCNTPKTPGEATRKWGWPQGLLGVLRHLVEPKNR